MFFRTRKAFYFNCSDFLVCCLPIHCDKLIMPSFLNTIAFWLWKNIYIFRFSFFFKFFGFFSFKIKVHFRKIFWLMLVLINNIGKYFSHYCFRGVYQNLFMYFQPIKFRQGQNASFRKFRCSYHTKIKEDTAKGVLLIIDSSCICYFPALIFLIYLILIYYFRWRFHHYHYTYYGMLTPEL